MESMLFLRVFGLRLERFNDGACASFDEFGRVSLTRKHPDRIARIFSELPHMIQEEIGAAPPGPFFDDHGRVYKKESESVWTMMARKRNFPDVGDTLTLRRGGETLTLRVDSIGKLKVVTCQLILIS